MSVGVAPVALIAMQPLQAKDGASTVSSSTITTNTSSGSKIDPPKSSSHAKGGTKLTPLETTMIVLVFVLVVVAAIFAVVYGYRYTKKREYLARRSRSRRRRQNKKKKNKYMLGDQSTGFISINADDYTDVGAPHEPLNYSTMVHSDNDDEDEPLKK